MGEFIRALVEVFHFIWPIRLVQEWERAGYYVNGKWWKEVGPGMHFVVPWFCEVIPVNCAIALVGAGREDITLSDASTLSFAATATLKVVDIYKALNDVDNYHESTQELIGTYLAEKLAEADVERLTPEKRKRFFSTLQAGLASEAAQFGVEVTKLRFTSFVTNIPTYRLLVDQGHLNTW